MSGCSACVRSTINDSESLRWWLFSNFGAQKMCPEMQKVGIPLKMQGLGAASIGRFFPQACNVQVYDATRTVIVTVNGEGYAFLPFTRRIGFYCGISVEYRPDFRMEKDALYVWGTFNRAVTAPDLRILGVENPAVGLAMQTPVGSVGTILGQGIVTGELARGFTVVRTDSGDAFALGRLDPPAKPKQQFSSNDDRVVLGSDMTEVHASSRDYLGPFTVENDDASLFLRFDTANAPLDYVVVDRTVGDMWRAGYMRAQPIGPPPGNPISYGALPLGPTQARVDVRRGSYYVVVENRAISPLAPILPVPLGEAIGYVRYNVEVGERP
jgi:hypothetical protein